MMPNDVFKMPALSFVNSQAFRLACSTVFNSVDKNHDGIVDEDEILLAMCKMHYKLAKKFPGVTEPPSIEQVRAKLIEFDIDRSSGLNQEEFVKFATKWFKQRGIVYIGRMIITAIFGMVLLPNGANMLQQKNSFTRRIPKQVFSVVVGVVFKLISTRFPTIESHST